jgi:hypothetical protein
MAAHGGILRLDRVGQHLEEGQRALGLDRGCRREVRSRTREHRAEPVAQPRIGFDLIEDVRDVHIATYDFTQLFEERHQPPPPAATRHGAVDRRRHLHHVEGLLEVVANAVADRVGRRVEIAVAGDDDHLDVREVEADRTHQLLAAQAGHRQIERHDVHGRRVEDFERFGAARNHRDRVVRRENHAERLTGAAFVVDDEHVRAYGAAIDHTGLLVAPRVRVSPASQQ